MWTRIAKARAALVLVAALSCLGGAAHAGVNAGNLHALSPSGEERGDCPLKHTDVNVSISGFIGRVTLTQQFSNPFHQAIEAVYTFPMSDRAAVDSMTMTVGDRVIRGLIKERGEARAIYEQARAAGQAAGLLDQERPNIFTQSVANIMPGEDVNITISYVEYLNYEGGEYEFSFPMVVGPRYIPGAVECRTPAGTVQVPDAGRITPPLTPEGIRAGHDISLRVEMDAGVPIQAIQSVLHEVDVIRNSGNKAIVQLCNRNEIPNRDFVLKYAVAGDEINDAVLVHADARGGFFSLILQPPKHVEPKSVTPKEMMFVIDSSGSMSGFPIETAKKTMRMCIEQMNPNDTFNLVSFAGGLGYCFDRPVANTRENRAKALEYLRNLEGGGGTEMMAAINAALAGQCDPERLRVVCFMTDGFIGNDMAILDAIQKNAGQARVFAFGIGNSVNRFLVDGMGREGRGATEIVTLESDGDAAAQRFQDRVHSPLLTNVELDFGGLDVENLFPAPHSLPDLFAARPLIITGRYERAGKGYVTLSGRTAAGPFKRKIHLDLPEIEDANDVLAPLWARQQIDTLMARDWAGMQIGQPLADVQGKITKLGLEYNLLTQFTSFVAVEDRIVNENGRSRRIEVPVEMPDGVSYEGIFGSRDADASVAGRMAETKARQLLSSNSVAVATSIAPETAASAPASLALRTPVEESARQEFTQPEGERMRVEVDKPDTNELLKDRLDDAAAEKLPPSLAKLIGGSIADGQYDGFTVTNGMIEIVLHLERDNDAALDQIKGLGARVLGHARSSKRLLITVPVTALGDLAKLDFVMRIGAQEL